MEMKGEITHRFAGHVAGSRRYNTSNRISDWDFKFEDSPGMRMFLLAHEWVLVKEFPRGTRGNKTSYWKHKRCNTELYLQYSNEVGNTVTKIGRFLQFFEVMHDKRYRKPIWNAIDDCITIIYNTVKAHKEHKANRDKRGYGYRDTPLQ